MDKTAIKNYAVQARKNLIKAVTLKANQLHIFEDGDKTIRQSKEVADLLMAADIHLTIDQLKAREYLVSELSAEDTSYKSAVFHRKMEEIAYTWFNRLIALRFMEVNNYLPSRIRILSSHEQGRLEPDALRDVEMLDYVDHSEVIKLRTDTAFNAPEKLYRYILISQCNALSEILPRMFQKINDYTELLLPDMLFSEDGIVYDFINAVHEDNFSIEKQGQIEIIGWLYQYYTSEKKDEVFAALKKNVKLNKDTIPAATQLFTPEWIVKYMVENSLGRLWLEKHPNEELRASWKYYIDEAEQEPEVTERLRVLRSQSPINRPEDIKLIDPCMGSGHILVYAFDVLFQIYESVGYSEREIPNLILQNNIHGLDIDDRAGQLAYFALMMKARGYNRRFFRQDIVPQPKVFAVPESGQKMQILGLSQYLGASMEEAERIAALDDFKYVMNLFENGKEYGSLLKVERDVDYDRLKRYINDFAQGQLTVDETFLMEQMESFESLFDVAGLLARKYDTVVTNPPYMGASGMNKMLSEFVKKYYSDSKSDLCVTFIERNFEFINSNGFLSMITMHSWMFLSSYERLREKLIAYKSIINMVHLGTRAFEEIGGEVVQTTAFITRNQNIANYNATYTRLIDFNNQHTKKEAFLARTNMYISKQEGFRKISKCPIVYWASKNILASYEQGALLGEYGRVSEGVKTGNNDRFIRLWFEVELQKFSLSRKSTGYKWYPHQKGGEFRKWYGNLEWVINWENDGHEIKSESNSGLQGKDMYFEPLICWSKITIKGSSFRLMPENIMFDSGSPAIMPKGDLLYILGLLNSSASKLILSITNPTINTQVGDIKGIPYIMKYKDVVEQIVGQNVNISKMDWDSFETSWDFSRHPLINGEKSIKDAFVQWDADCNQRFSRLKVSEEELNRIFIDIYGLQNELTPDVEDKNVTIRKADLSRDIRSFISYAVGCLFGRYSLDESGLVFAGGKFDLSRYKTFIPSKYNALHIGTKDYFEDDIVLRFVEFVRAVYGDDSLADNLDFIADALYPDSEASSRERIRRYFLNDFYKDHLKIYQKRPIYWMFDSGKKNGFKALMYLHRYDKYTIAIARTEYMHTLNRKYDAEIKRLELSISESDYAHEKAVSRKEINILQSQMDECRIYDQVVAHIAHQQISLDLDDGVKVNYAKFQGVEVPKTDGSTEKMNLFAKI